MTQDLQHYVYALMDPRDNVIFYIGKGEGDRASAHIKEAASLQKDSAKSRRINDIKASNKEVRILILARHFELASEAYTVESLLINQAREMGEVFGISAELTNVKPGNQEGRFRPWNSPDELAGFEYPKPVVTTAETYAACQPLYDHIIEAVPEFKNPLRAAGQFIRSQKNERGFEFVLMAKQGYLIYFEYIGRKQDAEQKEHAERLRSVTGFGGAYAHAKVEIQRPDLQIQDHVEVAEAMREFISTIKRTEVAIEL